MFLSHKVKISPTLNIVILILSVSFLIASATIPKNAVAATKATKIEQKKYENLYRATKAIDGATAVGVNYQKFCELLQNLSTEISIANDIAQSSTEKKLIKSYSEVLTIFQESAELWKYKIKVSQYEWMPRGQIYVDPEIYPIVEKYSFPMESHQTYGGSFSTIPEKSIQILWNKAQEQLEQTIKIYRGQ